MRIMIKGGVWKNTEDEILKAAVMKYGLNQWARISSLLTRKSAKQCKARWYEWLDPEIKKTEWTKEEDEKLLHLAKLFPTQWRTIAPIVGRTSAQCLERYEKLLDLALSKDDTYDPDDDPRRLRAGEIDPNPESKPARPDPVDMDEDEKEMLSEARARLANTRGKKAKRKAREKQLEEARRLAFMQKNRELRAAGIELRFRDKIRRGLDYNREVAFEKKPPVGFYDTTDEQKQTHVASKEFRPVALQNAELKSRKYIEDALMKQDMRRQKILADHNQPAALAKAAQLNDPGMNRRRSKLLLPEPQVSDQELLQISKTGAAMNVDEDLADGAGGDVTRKLLGQYDQTPSLTATAVRTPRTPMVGGGDRVLQEAHNLAKMQSAETPLLGHENPTLFPSDFQSVKPKRDIAATPNPLVSASLLGTPRSGQAGGPSELRTPVRDALGLNVSDTESVTSASVSTAQRVMMRNQLKAKLAQLPEAKNKAEIVLPELPEDEEDEMLVEEDEIELDAVELEKLKKAAAEEKALREFRKKSQVIQRGLPRPTLDETWLDGSTAPVTVMDRAEDLVKREMLSIILHENITDPVEKKKRSKKSKKRMQRGAAADDHFELFEDNELKEAGLLVAEEVHLTADRCPDRSLLDLYEDDRDTRLIWIPSQQTYAREISASKADSIQSMKESYQAVRSEMERETRKVTRLEEKVRVVCAGHWARHSSLQSSIHASWNALCEETVDLTSYTRLKAAEDIAGPVRLAELEEHVQQQRRLEDQLQREYKALQDEEDTMKETLEANSPTA